MFIEELHAQHFHVHQDGAICQTQKERLHFVLVKLVLNLLTCQHVAGVTSNFFLFNFFIYLHEDARAAVITNCIEYKCTIIEFYTISVRIHVLHTFLFY